MSSLNSEMQMRALLAEDEHGEEPASSRLKARLYTALIHKQQESGPLASLEESVSLGHGICVFENLVQITPTAAAVKSRFFCQICHARVLAEHLEDPPIFWASCPYVQFKN